MVLPDQDVALPDGAVPQLDEESGHPAMLVVPVPESDARAPLQGVSGVEGAAEDPVGRGTEGDGGGERPVEDPEPLGGREVWAGSTRLSLHHGCGKAGAGRGGWSERGVGGGAAGVPGGAGSGAEEPEAGGTPLFLPTPDFMASAGTV